MSDNDKVRVYNPDIKKALVTIITPYYDAKEKFMDMFYSVINQTFPWFEWIIIRESKSKQADIDILEEYAEKDARISILIKSEHEFNCDTCLEYGSTDFVVLINEDIIMKPQYLEYMYWSLYYNEDAVLTYTDSVEVKGSEHIAKHRLIVGDVGNLPLAAMIRRAEYQTAGEYKIIHVPLALVLYHRRDTRTKKSDIKIKEIEFIGKYERYPFYRTQYIKWRELSNQKGSEKRVLWIVPQMVVGGADKFNLDAIAGLNKLGYKNYVVTTMHTDHVWRERFEKCTDEVYCLAEFLNPVHFMEYVSYIIQSRQIDILIVSNSYAGYYMLPWIREHFSQLVIVDYLHLEEWYWRAGGYARTSAAVHGITEKTYVCNSSTRKVLIDEFGCDPRAVDCMYIGVDHQYFDKNKEKTGYLHERLGIAEDRPIVLFPCRISEQKRPFMVINIAQGVMKVIPDVAFVIVGDGSQLPELQQVIRKKRLKKHIYCNGASDNMRACYRDANAVLICSINEGLALTAYEACSMGVPVVSSDVGGQRDLIGDDVGALIPMQQAATDIDNRNFSQDEVDMYISKLVHILSDAEYADKLGAAARKKIENGFSIELMVKQLDQELQMLYNDEDRKQQRKKVSNALMMMSHMSMDYYTMYLQWESSLQNHGIMPLLYILYNVLLKIPVLNIPVRAAGRILYRRMLK